MGSLILFILWFVTRTKDCFCIFLKENYLDTNMNVSNTIMNFGLLQSTKLSPSIILVRTVWNRPKRLTPNHTRDHNLKQRKNAELTEEDNEKEVHKPKMPFMAYDEEFAKVTTFENQLLS